jgi:hypothetical protein
MFMTFIVLDYFFIAKQMLGLQYTIEIIPVGTLSAVILTIGIIIYF